MEYQRLRLVVLTLLQLCRTEDITPRWYPASEGYQQKPFSELFTTSVPLVSSFSTESPILVRNDLDGSHYSSQQTLPHQSSMSQPTTNMPAGALYNVPLTQNNPIDYRYDSKWDSLPVLQSLSSHKEVETNLDLVSSTPMPAISEITVKPQAPKKRFTLGLPLNALFEPERKTTFIQPQSQATFAVPQTRTTVNQPNTIVQPQSQTTFALPQTRMTVNQPTTFIQPQSQTFVVPQSRTTVNQPTTYVQAQPQTFAVPQTRTTVNQPTTFAQPQLQMFAVPQTRSTVNQPTTFFQQRLQNGFALAQTRTTANQPITFVQPQSQATFVLPQARTTGNQPTTFVQQQSQTMFALPQTRTTVNQPTTFVQQQSQTMFALPQTRTAGNQLPTTSLVTSFNNQPLNIIPIQATFSTTPLSTLTTTPTTLLISTPPTITPPLTQPSVLSSDFTNQQTTLPPTAQLSSSNLTTTTPQRTFIWTRYNPGPSMTRVTVTPSSTTGMFKQNITNIVPSPLTSLPNRLNRRQVLAVPLRIRVVAPTGSITNVLIHPGSRTTTRRPTTRRTNRPGNSNNYERCLAGCRNVRDPICAAPLSQITIDARSLRGFPSICYMACHNSYRREPFEKVIDGNCSRLRDRIRLMDSNTRMTRNELLRNMYTIQNNRSTFVEVSGLE